MKNNSALEFFKNLKSVNTLEKKNVIILLLSFLGSAFFDLLGLSIIGPYTEYFFFEKVSNTNFLIDIINIFTDNKEKIFFYSTILLIVTFISKAFFGFYVVKKIIFFSNIEQAKLITKLSINLVSKNKTSSYASQIINNFLYNIKIYTEQTLITVLRLSAEIIVVGAIMTYLLINYFLISSIIFLLMFFCITLYLILVQKRLIKFGKIASGSSEKIIQDTVNIISGIKDIIVYNKEEVFREKIKNNIFNQMISSAKANSYALLPKYFYDGFFISIFVLILYFGSSFFSKGQVVVYISVMGLAMYRLLPSLLQISICISNLKFSKTHFSEVIKLSRELQEEEKIHEKSNEDHKFDKIESIKLSNINFSFKDNNEEKNILNNFSLELKKGEKLYLYGDSGKGKSTIANILCGFDNFQNGEYKVNGNKVNSIKNFAKKHISYCSQLPFITRGTILENIIIFDSSINKDKLNFAIKASCVDEIINKKNISLDDQISDFGLNFSGGERQRIQIARAIYYDKEIIIFDETTSAIEIELEKRILNNLDKYLSNKVFLFISHRKSNMNLFDNVLQI